MTSLFKKLNFKNQPSIYCLNHPESFQQQLDEMAMFTDVKTLVRSNAKIEFILVFVTRQKEIDKYVKKLGPLLEGDALVWMCYPKKSSKNYTCDFNRDTGWDIMGEYDLEGVRMVAIDEDWSALRFRNIKYIKNFKRKFDALSKKGKKIVKKNRDKF